MPGGSAGRGGGTARGEAQAESAISPANNATPAAGRNSSSFVRRSPSWQDRFPTINPRLLFPLARRLAQEPPLDASRYQAHASRNTCICK
jgi:hypothetical protein